jgi:hypothetical protein
MRYLCLVIIFFAFFAPIKSYATDPMSDILIYKGIKYSSSNLNLLYPYLTKAKKEWRDTNDWCSAGRYYAIFEIVGNELILKDIRNCSEKSLLKEFLSAFNVKGSIFKLNFYTDSLIIAEGRPLYDYIYEYYSILHFEKGKLIKETRMDYKEYLSLRRDRPAWLGVLSGVDDNSSMPKLYAEEYQTILEIIEHYMETKKGNKSKFLTELKTKYEKKFGKPMSDFELKIHKIYFLNGYELEITRTLYGAQARYLSKNGGLNGLIEAKLNIEEWLDIIRALSTCCLDKWERVSKSIGRYYRVEDGVFYIYSSSKNRVYDERYEFPIKSGQLPNLDEFQKVMDDIVAKIREKPAELRTP